jgi:hypothetical protein
MATKQSSVSPRHVAHLRLRTFGARLDCFASLAMTDFYCVASAEMLPT